MANTFLNPKHRIVRSQTYRGRAMDVAGPGNAVVFAGRRAS